MKLKRDELQKHINTLPYTELKDMVLSYAHNHNIDVQEDIETLSTIDLQRKLEKLGINKVCPKCGSKHVVKNGNRKHVQRYKCKSCQNQFTLFTNTILEKTKWHWNVWIKMIELTLNGYSLEGTRYILKKDFHCTGLDHKTVFLWRHKIIHALASMPQPKLHDVVQIDETFVRESQKGSRNLVSYIDKIDVREPRYSRQPSKYGVMGAEFATITTAVDSSGHCVCKVSGLGRLTSHVFGSLFEEHMLAPAFICTDANPIYEEYCNVFNITHYERPSNYNKVLEQYGCVTPSRKDKVLSDKQYEANQIIKRNLYKKGYIDKITNKGFIDFEEFRNLKVINGLNLSRVNSLHKEIKRFITKDMTNVSTKYLSDYIGFFSYAHNYKIDNKNASFSSKDAEKILIEILKNSTKYTLSELKATVLTLPKPSSRYLTLLKSKTEEARKITKNPYFKFDEEDKVVSFDKRKYLSDLPVSKLKEICKQYRINYRSKWVLWANISQILNHPDCNKIIIESIQRDKLVQVTDEDLEYIEKEQYHHKNNSA